MTSAYPLTDIVGDDHDAVDKLKAIHIWQSEKLLDQAKRPRDRKTLSGRSGIAERTILDFANAADLMRVKGIGTEHVALLRAVGVFTIRDLRCRNARNLTDTMAMKNSQQRVLEMAPPEVFVRRWVEQAKQLPLVISYK